MTDVPPESSDDADLLRRIARRDRQAFAALYRRYHPRLHGYLRRLLSDAQVAAGGLRRRDVRRLEGRAALCRQLGGIELDFGIAYRRAMSALRSELRHHARVDHAADAEAIAADRPQGRDLINTALRRLSPNHRQVVELTYFFGFSYKEIAVIADCPVNTVKTRMYHARKRLKYLLPRLAGEKEGQDREHGYKMTHDAAAELLPWLANDSLPHDEKGRVLAHAKSCVVCRKELAELEALRDTVSAGAVDAYVPPVDMRRINRRIDAYMDKRRRVPRAFEALGAFFSSPWKAAAACRRSSSSHCSSRWWTGRATLRSTPR